MEAMRITLRPCVESDTEILEAARNDPDSVAFSRRGALSRDEITGYYIVNPRKHTYMIATRSESLGYVALEEDTLHNDFLEISIAIHPNARGRGIAKRALQVALQQAQMQFTSKIGIHAWIHDTNIVSKQLFAGMGFVPNGETSIIAGRCLSQYEVLW
jgi:L-amino acid N-acyltransferase YncA